MNGAPLRRVELGVCKTDKFCVLNRVCACVGRALHDDESVPVVEIVRTQWLVRQHDSLRSVVHEVGVCVRKRHNQRCLWTSIRYTLLRGALPHVLNQVRHRVDRRIRRECQLEGVVTREQNVETQHTRFWKRFRHVLQGRKSNF